MKYIQYLVGMVGIFFLFCFFQGCSKMKPINGSQSYFLKNGKVIYSYHGSKIIKGANEVKGADIETFTPLNDYFAKDKNCVYWHSSKIEKADPKTFQFLKNTEYQNSFSNYYTRDKNYFFYTTKILENVDADTFTVYGYNAKDKNYLYCKGKAFDKKEYSRCP